MTDKEVLVIGELNVDILLNNINGFPIIGEEILADNLSLTLGSSSAIFAANLSLSGITTFFCGLVGKDLLGKFILNELNNKKVATSLFTESEAYQTGLTMVLNYQQDCANVTYCGSVLKAASELNQPLILQLTSSSIDYIGLNTAVNLARTGLKDFGVEGWLHLDHSSSVELAQACLDAGFNPFSKIRKR